MSGFSSACRAGALCALVACAGTAQAVYLDDTSGQALIYPYYSVRSAGGDMWNAYISIVNHEPEAKALRVRLREVGNGVEVLGFNLFLAPNDVWTAAIVPASNAPGAGAVLITADASCTNPAIPPAGLPARSAGPDGEGYIEIIEMSTVQGAAAAAVTQQVEGFRPDCAFVQGETVPLTGFVAPPRGGLSGTLTLINVNSGMDMGVRAVAFADLTTQSFYRNYNDPYPDFDSAEVRPESHIVADGKAYALKWTNGVDAVSSVMMARYVINEFILETDTASRTDWVLTMPTRRFGASARPFGLKSRTLGLKGYDRDARPAVFGSAFCEFLPQEVDVVAANVLVIREEGMQSPSLFGAAKAMFGGVVSLRRNAGWLTVSASAQSFCNYHPPDGFASMESTGGSTATDLATGMVTTGRFSLEGLPWIGFMARTFTNGTLACVTGKCQGNYGGSFPHRYRRSIQLVP